MIDENFYSALEFKLTKAFSKADNELINSFWCDGILPIPAEDVTRIGKKYKKELRTTAFLGNDGQERYLMTIFFGPKALTNYSRGIDLEDCIPDHTKNNWFAVDVVNKSISIRLL
ncbi:hypothetical protein ESA94_09085 [Lacibacter luteus]|uniref:Uncharacterized protein n=1 Tax=Lacibacter luteus TaxID=2508719 RepID=A0A4Q1CJQ3_9BACT|nr:hypothetical protein [Lacibacter luteus]RXK60607.1 hypothetical protein ESA94_09085 [Lacibacter luteus]